MRTLSRTHGICVAWLHEAYERGEFELRWTASCEMAADIFTKAFANPHAWEAACSLVNICLPHAVQALADRNGIPPAPEGGGKLGLWHVNDDGSGTWTRHDSAQDKFRPLRPAGPADEEITCRETYDGDTGELINVTRDWANCKNKSEVLPGGHPRRLRTVFHFASTRSSYCPRSSSAAVGS